MKSFLLVILLLITCYPTFAQNAILSVPDTSQMQYVGPDDWYETNYGTVVFEKAPLYCYPDTNSGVIHIESSNERLVVLKKGVANSEFWMKVKDDAQRVGYMRAKSIARRLLENYEDSVVYFIQENFRMKEYDAFYFRIIKCNKITNDTICSYEFQKMGSYYHVQFVPTQYNLIKNSELLIHIDMGTPSCGSIRYELFVVDIGKALIKIAGSIGEGEAGDYSFTSCFIPMKFGQKKMLVANAEVNEIFNTQTGELNIFPYPKELGIPINELIVEVEKEGHGVYNEEMGDYEMEPDGNYKSIPTKHLVTYYRWNGKVRMKVLTKDLMPAKK